MLLNTNFILKKNNRAFTLVELLIAVGILSILSGLIIQALKPSLMRNRAQDAVRKEDISVMAGSFERFYADNNRYPDPSEIPSPGSKFTVGGITYLQAVPGDPDDNSAYSYTSPSPNQTFQICATLEDPNGATNPFCIRNAF